MELYIGTEIYSSIRNVSFSPEVSVAGTSLPVGEMSADIITDDSISVGSYAILAESYRSVHFCKFWIVSADRIEPGTVRIRAQSRLCLLDRVKMSAVMYSDSVAWSVLHDIFNTLSMTEYDIDDEIYSKTITGFCPEQTARERLLSVCFALGAYVRNFGDTQDVLTLFRDKIEVLPIDDTAVPVPLEKTFWRPAIGYRDHVTAVKAWSYIYTARTPQSGEQSVTDGTTTWVVSKQAHTLTNTSAPETAPENVVEVDLGLIHSNNVDDILSHLAKYYFPRVELQFDCVNNGDYWPGDKLQVCTDIDGMAVTGYAERMDFKFGVQARSSVKLTACALTSTAKLTIIYKWNDTTIARKVYHFPVGYEYTVQNPYPETTAGKYRYVFRPVNANATGTMTAGTNTNTQQLAVALKLDTKTKVLEVISVDAVEVQTVGEDAVGVIT